MRAKNLAEQLHFELGREGDCTLVHGVKEVSLDLARHLPETWTAWWESETYHRPDPNLPTIGCVASAEISVKAPGAQDPALTIYVRVYKSETRAWITLFSARVGFRTDTRTQEYYTAIDLVQDIRWVWAPREEPKQGLSA